MSGTTVIELEDVSFAYGGPPVLEHISLRVEKGEFLGLIGPNGGGKSTLLRIILGLLKPHRGRVSVLGTPPETSRTRIGYVPQFASFRADFPISVEETVKLSRLGTPLFSRYSVADRRAVDQALADSEIEDLRKRRIGSLSGGQLQRVLLARALASEPDIMMLDEPTANIDLRAEEDIFSMLKKLCARMTVVVVSHDVGFISHYVTRVACLNRTLLCHQTDRLSGDLIKDLYGAPIRAISHDH